MKQPFFILGNPRSGTTLIRLMLDAHPYITVPPECGFMIWFLNKYGQWNKTDCSPERINNFVTDLKTAKKIDSWNLNYKNLEDHLLRTLPENYASLVNQTYLFFASQYNNTEQIWGDKNNFYLHHIKEILAIFENAKFIHIIRDGRDVACSYKELNGKQIKSEFAPKLSNNIKEIANEWISNNKLILDNLNLYVKPENYISVKFERLVTKSKEELKRISNFLKVEYSPQMVEYYNYSKTYEPDEFFQWKANTKKAPQINRIQRYLSDLTPDEIEHFNQKAAELLKQFNYDC